jgi:hypothetical protein
LAALCAHLTQEARRALSALSICPVKPDLFSQEEAEAVAACEPTVLAELLDAGLLEAEDEHYRIHPVVADYARFSLSPQAEEEARGRLLAYRARPREVEVEPASDPIIDESPFSGMQIGLVAYADACENGWEEYSQRRARHAFVWRTLRLRMVAGKRGRQDRLSLRPP